MQAKQSKTIPQQVTFKIPDSNPPKEVTLLAGPAHFGQVLQDSKKVSSKLAQADPIVACSDLVDPEALKDKIAVIMRGDCVFVEKVKKNSN